MRYQGKIFRPPSEAQSLLIQATIGCPHNRCTFCAMYRGQPFRIRPVQEIKEDLQMALEYYGETVETIFFPDGNSIIMKTDDLAEVLHYARELFPRLKRMTLYGSAKFLNLKSLHEFRRLRQAGLSRIHSGMETGSELILADIRKGFTTNEVIDSGLRVREAGIELSEYILVGIGGRGRSGEHARESARVLNTFKPEFIRLRTFIPIPGTPLFQNCQTGQFQLPGPHDALREIRLLIESLDGPGEILSDHVSNFAQIEGRIPYDKPQMLNILDHLLTIPEYQFRQEYPKVL